MARSSSSCTIKALWACTFHIQSSLCRRKTEHRVCATRSRRPSTWFSRVQGWLRMRPQTDMQTWCKKFSKFSNCSKRWSSSRSAVALTSRRLMHLRFRLVTSRGDMQVQTSSKYKAPLLSRATRSVHTATSSQRRTETPQIGFWCRRTPKLQCQCFQCRMRPNWQTLSQNCKQKKTLSANKSSRRGNHF